MKYRKKPIEIEAMQFDGSMASGDAIEAWSGGVATPQGYYPNAKHGGMGAPEEMVLGVFVKTLEGMMRADPRDWIIRGVKGEFYPCKPDIFIATYDPV